MTVVKNISTSNELKRIASAYVIDFKNLTKEETLLALEKTAPQYYFRENVIKNLELCTYHSNNNIRVLVPIILKMILLNKDDFKAEYRKLNEEVIHFEQSIVNRANEYSIQKTHPKKDAFELFSFVLETAWEQGGSVSTEEKNLIVKIQKKLGISEDEAMILESKLGRFPKAKNLLHTNEEIYEVKRELQRMGLLFQIRDDDGNDYDIIPDELAKTYREIYGLEIKKQGYLRLIENKRLKSKEYLEGIIDRSGLIAQKGMLLKDLRSFIIDNIRPSNLIGGYSIRDGLSSSDLIEWNKELGLMTSKNKDGLISQIIDYYDAFKEKIEQKADERQMWYDVFTLLAGRKSDELRKMNLIVKDIEIERLFEKATNYLFGIKLHNEPLDLIGAEHPDGVLSFNDKLIMWDNKSKETDVDLKDHIAQFDRYIRSSVKPVASFLVIGPSFTESSVDEAIKYQLLNDTVITLITADQLKEIAEKWFVKKGDEPFPLGYFKQPGRFNQKLINY